MTQLGAEIATIRVIEPDDVAAPGEETPADTEERETQQIG